MVQIEDLLSGNVHIGRESDARLFRVVRPSSIWQSRYADSQDSNPPEIESTGTGLQMLWDGLMAPDGEMEVQISVNVDLARDSSEATFSTEVKNLGEGLIQEMRFPWVGGWTGLAGKGEDQARCGCVPLDPHHLPSGKSSNNLGGSKRRKYFVYNHQMLLPFFDISGGGSGLSYICYQRRPALGGVVVENLDRDPESLSLSWSWLHHLFIAKGETWCSPPIGISPHQTDWHATADRYREFLEKWWSPPPATSELRTKIGFQTIQTRGFDGTPFHNFEEIPALAQDGLDFGVKDLCIWDPMAGLYLRPDEGDFWEEFDPSRDPEALREGLEEARKMGVNVSTLLNFRLIRGNSDLYREFGEQRALRTVFGNPYSEDWSTCSYNHAGFRTKYLSRDGRVLCMKSQGHRERCWEVVRESLDMGFTSLFLDQTFEGLPCFSDLHGHSSPDDTHQSTLDWAARAAAAVRERDPRAYVIGEQCDLFAMAHINVNWSWGWSNLAPEVILYTLPEALLCWVVDRQPKELNRAFAMGCLAALTTGQAEESIAAYPEFGSRVRALAELRKRCAGYTVLARFRDILGIRAENALAYVYECDQGLGVVIAEVNGRVVEATVELDTSILGRSPKGRPTIHLMNGEDMEFSGTRKGDRLTLKIDLQPLEVAVWTIPCHEKR